MNPDGTLGFYMERLPDECSYSFLCRCAVRIPNVSSNRVISALFGKQHLLSQYVFKAFRTMDIQRWFGNDPKWSRESFMTGNSCMPYCSIMFSDKYLSIFLDSIERKPVLHRVEEMQVTRASGFNAFRYKRLRYCPACAVNDLRTYGEQYWHRLPQLPGIMVCPEHGLEIMESDYDFRYIAHRFVPASYAIRIPKQYASTIPSSFIDKYVRIADDTRWLLKNGLKLRKAMDTLISKKDGHSPDSKPINEIAENRIHSDFDEEFLMHLYDKTAYLTEPGNLQRDWLFSIRHPLLYLVEIEMQYGSVQAFFKSLQ